MRKENTGLITLESVYETANIVSAFKKARRKNYFLGADGFDCRTISDVPEYISHFIHNLKNYKPKPLKKVTIMSYCNTKLITFEVSCFSDRILEYAIRNKLTEIVDPLFCEHVCGFRGRGRNKNYYHLLEQLKFNYEKIISFDIKNYFRSINSERLLSKLSSYCDQEVLELIGKMVFRETSQGLPLGHALSPILSNIYLMIIDESFQNYPVIRFGDNYVFGFNNEMESQFLEEELKFQLSQEGLCLNDQKTMLIESSQMKGIL